MNIRNKLFKIFGISAIALSVQSSFALSIPGTDWPVHDETLNSTMKALLKMQETVLQAAKTSADMTTQSANNASKSTNDTMYRLSVMNEQKARVMNSAPTVDKCVQLSKSMAGGVLNTVQDTTAVAMFKGSAQSRDSYGKTNYNSVVAAAKTLGTCTSADVTDGVKGCTQVGAFAGLDISSTGLTRNPLTNNRSLSEDQVKVAQQYVHNFVDALAPERLEGGEQGKSQIYNTKWKIYQARVSPVTEALNYDIQNSRGIDISKSPTVNQMWTDPDMKAAWTQVMGTTPPENPSMADIIRVDVLRKKYYSGDIAKRYTASTEVDLLREQNDLLATNNVLQLQNLEQARLLKNLAASLVMNQYAPIDNNINQSATSGN